jgi:hypothetical protein
MTTRNTVSIGVAFQDQYLKNADLENCSLLGSTAIAMGTSAAPVSATTAGNFNSAYATTSATTGDTRLSYNRLTFTSTGSGETIRALTQVTGANGATGGTINGAHVTLSVNGSGTISGAGNALRATLGGTSTAPGGTLAAIQADSDFATGGSWTGASFIRCTNSGTGVIAQLFDLPTKGANLMFRDKTSAAVTQVIKITSNGTPYYIMVSDQP